MGNATVDMTKSDSNSDSDSDVSVKKAPRGRKPGNAKEAFSTTAGPLRASSGDWRAREAGGSGGSGVPFCCGHLPAQIWAALCPCNLGLFYQTTRAPAEHLPVFLQLKNPLPSLVVGNQSPSVSRPAPAAIGEISVTLGAGLEGHLPSVHGVQACSVLCSDSDSDVDRISEWKRRDEERRRELEEKRKREQEEEIRRLREQEKEEKEKRKEKAEKGEEMHSDSDSSAEDEVAKKGRKGRAKAPSSSDSELELEKEVSTEPWGAGDRQTAHPLGSDQQGPPGVAGTCCLSLVLPWDCPGSTGKGFVSVGTSMPCKWELFSWPGMPHPAVGLTSP